MFNKANYAVHGNGNEINHNRQCYQYSQNMSNNYMNHQDNLRMHTYREYNDQHKPTLTPSEQGSQIWDKFLSGMKGLYADYYMFDVPKENIERFAKWLFEDFQIRSVSHIYAMKPDFLNKYLQQEQYKRYAGAAIIVSQISENTQRMKKEKQNKKQINNAKFGNSKKRKRNWGSKDEAIDLTSISDTSDIDSDCEVIDHVKEEPSATTTSTEPAKKRQRTNAPTNRRPSGSKISSRQELPLPEEIKKYAYEKGHHFIFEQPEIKTMTINGTKGKFKVIGQQLKEERKKGKGKKDEKGTKILKYADLYQCSDCTKRGLYNGIRSHAAAQHDQYKKKSK